MAVYILFGLITLLILLFHFLSSWDVYKAKFGETGVVMIATLAFTVGLIAWPLTLVLLSLRLLLKVKGVQTNA